MIDLALVTSTALHSANLVALVDKIRTDEKVKEAVKALNNDVIQLQSLTLSLQINLSSMQSEKTELMNQNHALQAKLADREQYELAEVVSGFFAYRSKEVITGTTPLHWVCAYCYDKGVKSIFQFAYKAESKVCHRCHSCQSDYYV